jgi:Zn-dependent protease
MHRTGWIVVLFCLGVGFLMGGRQLGFLLGALLFASLLLHEAGHILTAAYFRVPVHECGIKLGGVYIRRGYALRRRDEILIAASGPMVNLLIVFPLLCVPRLGSQIAMCNAVIGLINLVPLPSSDGLHILRNLAPYTLCATSRLRSEPATESWCRNPLDPSRIKLDKP